MKSRKSALAGILLTAAAAVPSVAQEVAVIPPPIAASEVCAGCFAYLEFPPQPAADTPRLVDPQSVVPHQASEAGATPDPAAQKFRIVATQQP